MVSVDQRRSQNSSALMRSGIDSQGKVRLILPRGSSMGKSISKKRRIDEELEHNLQADMGDDANLVFKENKFSVFDRLSIKNYSNMMKEKKVEQTYQIINFFDEQHKSATLSIFLYE